METCQRWHSYPVRVTCPVMAQTVLSSSVVNNLHSNWTVTLASHDVAALLMTDAGPEPSAELAPPCAYPFLDLQCTSANGSYIYNSTLVEYGL